MDTRVMRGVCASLLLLLSGGEAAAIGRFEHWPTDSPPTYATGVTPPHLTFQPYVPVAGRPDEVIQVDAAEGASIGPITAPFRVLIGRERTDRLFLSDFGWVTAAPIPTNLGAPPSRMLEGDGMPAVSVGADVYRRSAASIELRTRGLPGRRTFTVSFVDFRRSTIPGDVYSTSVRFEEATGDVVFGFLAGPAWGDFWDHQSLVFGMFTDRANEYWAHIRPTNGVSATIVASDCAGPAPRPDRDADTVVDACDSCPDAFDPAVRDRDIDGWGDVCDPRPDDSEVWTLLLDDDADRDGDGVPDPADLCLGFADPEQTDADGDGFGDACDPCPNEDARWAMSHDEDADGLCGADNCPLVANPDQADADGDGVGDACDECPGDLDGVEATWMQQDGDGVCWRHDVCPQVFDPEQADIDGDGLGDFCDAFPGLPDALDDDGVPEAVDVCPDVADPLQADLDEDGEGDLCDADLDGDGLDDDSADDLCLFVPEDGVTGRDVDPGLDMACDLASARLEILFVPKEGPLFVNFRVNGLDSGSYELESVEGPTDITLPMIEPIIRREAGGLCFAPQMLFYDSVDWTLEVAWVAISYPSQAGYDRVCLFDGKNNPNPTCTRTDPAAYPDGVDPAFAKTMDLTENSLAIWDDDDLGPGIGPGCTPDNCLGETNPDQADRDADGVGDACDSCPDIFDPGQRDRDRDRVNDVCDNCPDAMNTSQQDEDADGLGDACDPCVMVASNPPNDRDRDGWPSACDNCPDKWNSSQADADRDRRGDACDRCPTRADPGAPDRDRDGVPDACDNCRLRANTTQVDADRDGIGNPCDNCPAKANPDQRDTDRDGLGDACDAPARPR
jgi:hypothetical protein